MKDYKDFIAQQLVGKHIHFSCDCIIKFDIIGDVIGYEINNSEIIYIIKTGEKEIKIAENTPKLKVEIL